MAINDRTIQWNLQVAGAPQAVNDLTDVSGAMTNMDDASRIAATRFTGLASASSALGTVLSRTTPQVGGLASALGTAGGATSGLVTAIGGVGGLVAGGLIAALALSVDWFIRSEQAAESAKEEWLSAGEAAITSSQAMGEAAKQAALAQRKLFDVQTAGDFQKQIDDIEKKRLEKKEKAQKLQKENNNLLEGEAKKKHDGLLAEMASLGNQQRRLVFRRDEALKINTLIENEEKLVEFDEWKAKLKEKQAKSLKKIVDKTYEWLDATREVGKETEDIFRDWEKMADFDPFAGLKFEGDPDSELFKRRQLGEEIAAEFHQKGKERAAEEKGLAEETLQAHIDKWRGIEMAGHGAYSVVATEGANAFMELAKGGEVSAAAIIEGIGDQLYSKGIAHLLEAAAMAWIPGLQGNAGGLAAAGAIEMATGLAMGAAGSAAGGGSTGGGGVGGGTSGLAPARPTPVAEDILRQRQETPTTIHVHTLNPSVESGIAIDKSLTAARNKRGRYAMTYRN